MLFREMFDTNNNNRQNILQNLIVKGWINEIIKQAYHKLKCHIYYDVSMYSYYFNSFYYFFYSVRNRK